MTQEIAERAADFVDSLGVCAHPEGYTTEQATLIEGEMLFLGMHRIRAVTPAVNVTTYQSLGQLGIKFDLILNNTALQLNTSTGLDYELSLINSVAPYVSSVEGPNEVDLLPVPYKGLEGAAAAMALQHDLYTAVQSDPLLGNVSVLPFSLSYFATISDYGDMSAYADYANIHPYGAWGDAPYLWLSILLRNTTAPSDQTIITETGYATSNSVSGVNESVQAKYILDTLFEAYRDGVAQTYLYQIMDPYMDSVGTDPELHWGLFNSDGTPKLAAIAIHNLTTILSDTNANASTFTAGSLDYTVTGLPSQSGFSALLQKSNGNFDIELWQEPALWNRNTQTENAVSPTRVEVTFGSVMYEVQLFDPLLGTNPIATYSYITSLTIALGGDPLIIEVTPVGTPSVITFVPPSPVIIGLSYGTDKGPSPTDGITSSATPTLLGTAFAGCTVNVYDGAVLIGSAVADRAGVWALSVRTLAEGGHNFTAVAVTSAGSSPATAAYTVIVDTTAPTVATITASSPAGSIEHPGQTVTFTLTLTEPILLTTAGGSPTLTLSTGTVATFDASRSTATSLVFNTVLTGGQNSPNLAVTSLVLNGAYASDQAGNPLSNLILSNINGSNSGIVVDPTPVDVSIGSGPDTIRVGISETSWNGDAPFFITVDGVQIGGIQTATAIHGTSSQNYTLNGNFGPGSHNVAVTLLDSFADPSHLRSIYIDSISAGGTTATFSGGLSVPQMSLGHDSPALLGVTDPVTLGTGPDTIKVGVSEDAFHGNAPFTISVDGVQIGGIQAAQASHSAGQSQIFTLNGNFGPGSHTVAVILLDSVADPSHFRSIYIDSITASGTTATFSDGRSIPQLSLSHNSPAILGAANQVIAAVTLGTGPDTIKLGVSEDAFNGNAPFTISVDGVQIGGLQAAQASHSAGQSQIFTLNGNFGPGSHNVAVTLLDSIADPSHFRSIYIDSITASGTTATFSGGRSIPQLSLSYNSPAILGAADQVIDPVVLGTGPDTIKVGVSEDAFHGNTPFIIKVDGVQIGGLQAAQASHSAGQSQIFTLNGNFGSGSHNVAVTLVDSIADPSHFRSIYLDSITASGTTATFSGGLSVPQMSLSYNSPALLSVASQAIEAITLGTGPDTIKVGVSEDAFHGNAPFTISVDGVQIGGIQAAQASHSAGQSQIFTLNGSFGPGSHNVAVTLLDSVADPSHFRSIYIDSITASGTTATFSDGRSIPQLSLSHNSPALLGAANQVIAAVTLGTGPDTIKLGVSEDAFNGNAPFTISVDGVQIGGVQAAQASHSAGQSQIFTLNGNFGPGSHSVAVTLVDSIADPSHFRSIYIDSITASGTTATFSDGRSIPQLSLSHNSPAILGAPNRVIESITLSTGPDTIKVGVSEDAFNGHTPFTISVDGVQIGGIQAAQASHSAGQSQIFTLSGNFGPGSHNVAVTLLDSVADPSHFRSIYIDSITASGTTATFSGGLSVPQMSLSYNSPALVSAANQTIDAVTLGTGPDTIKLGVSEDAFHGNAPFTISVDGVQIGGIQAAQASHSAGQSQIFTLHGSFGPGSHTVAVTLLDSVADPSHLRSIYIDSITASGTTATFSGGLSVPQMSLSYNSPALMSAANPAITAVNVGPSPQTAPTPITATSLSLAVQSSTPQALTTFAPMTQPTTATNAPVTVAIIPSTSQQTENTTLQPTTAITTTVLPVSIATQSLNPQQNANTTLVSTTQPSANAATATPSVETAGMTFRFFDTIHGTQFMTSNLSERNTLIATRSDLSYEGTGMGTVASDPSDVNVASVYRFFSKVDGTHFFTTSTTERDSTIATRSDLLFEGAGFNEHLTAQAGDVAVYRFFNGSNGSHFFTSDAAERTTIAATRPDMVDEGIAFYAPKV